MKEIEKLLASDNVEGMIGNPKTIHSLRVEYGLLKKFIARPNLELGVHSMEGNIHLQDGELMIKYNI